MRLKIIAVTKFIFQGFLFPHGILSCFRQHRLKGFNTVQPENPSSACSADFYIGTPAKHLEKWHHVPQGFCLSFSIPAVVKL
jgi:hypothetical protein